MIHCGGGLAGARSPPEAGRDNGRLLPRGLGFRQHFLTGTRLPPEAGRDGWLLPLVALPSTEVQKTFSPVHMILSNALRILLAVAIPPIHKWHEAILIPLTESTFCTCEGQGTASPKAAGGTQPSFCGTAMERHDKQGRFGFENNNGFSAQATYR